MTAEDFAALRDLLVEVQSPLRLADKLLDHPDAEVLAEEAARLRTALDAWQKPPAQRGPERGIQGLLAALRRDGKGNWKVAGLPSQAAAKKRLQRLGVRGVRVCADGAVDSVSAVPTRARAPRTVPVVAGAAGGHSLGARVEERVGVGACE